MSSHTHIAVTGRAIASLLMLVVFSAADHPAAAAESGTQAEPKQADAKPTEKGKEPEFAPKTKMGLKLAGLVTFVASSCPELQPDYARFKSALGTLGLSTADLDRNEYKAAYLGYVLRYKEDKANNCARALKDFGPGGTAVSDLVKPKGK